MATSPLVTVERPAAGEPEGLLVLHHGRGTDESDLLGLADALDPEATAAGRLGARAAAACRAGRATTGTWCRGSAIPTATSFDAARDGARRAPRPALGGDRRRARADRARRLLDGRGDEPRDGAGAPTARRSPGCSPSAASCRPCRAGSPSFEDRQGDPRLHRPRRPRPGDRGRVRPRRPRPARRGRDRRHLPRVRASVHTIDPAHVCRSPPTGWRRRVPRRTEAARLGRA